ncbi:jg19411 [Pararge aegeria aegeria]|uniref:Jg19411 protein n=1 Tax=Pararge aegeria aegeria TaxID=348720 RepID=A0A8S4R720_9NEOP|nr:jg19411 [Pararge aegeria aegeria]
MDVRVPRCWGDNSAPVNAALVDPPELREVAGYKWPRIVEFGTPYKIPMSSSGRQPVDLVIVISKVKR